MPAHASWSIVRRISDQGAVYQTARHEHPLLAVHAVRAMTRVLGPGSFQITSAAGSRDPSEVRGT